MLNDSTPKRFNEFRPKKIKTLNSFSMTEYIKGQELTKTN